MAVAGFLVVIVHAHVCVCWIQAVFGVEPSNFQCIGGCEASKSGDIGVQYSNSLDSALFQGLGPFHLPYPAYRPALCHYVTLPW